LDKTWILSLKEYFNEAIQNKSEKNVGKMAIWFNRKNAKIKAENLFTRYDNFSVDDFNKLK
jgi:hypothetical protein